MAMDAHTSHLAVHKPSQLIHVSDFRKAVSAWPGVGMALSKVAEKAFAGSVTRAAAAPAKVWAELSTGEKRFGMARAGKLVSFLNGEK